MIVRGPAFLSRQAVIMEERGVAAWQEFLRRYAEKDPFFRQPVLPISQIPAEKFLAFNDALLTEFYGGDAQNYWRFGVKGAEWSFTRGQNRTIFQPGEARRFVLASGALWSSYYDEGKVVPVTGKGYVEVRLEGVPLKHVAFEYTSMGYLQGGIEYLGAKGTRFEALEGFSKGNDRVVYRFWVG